MTKRETDPDGFITVAKGPKPQQPHLGDFIWSPIGRSTSQGSKNRFRPLSLSDWQDIAADARGESHKGEVVEVVPPAALAPSSLLYYQHVHMCCDFKAAILSSVHVHDHSHASSSSEIATSSKEMGGDAGVEMLEQRDLERAEMYNGEGKGGCFLFDPSMGMQVRKRR